jgi:hypothetical protein
MKDLKNLVDRTHNDAWEITMPVVEAYRDNLANARQQLSQLLSEYVKRKGG